MEIFQTSQLLKAMPADLQAPLQKKILGVTTDTRQNCQQKLFFPLKGETFDGHNFFQQAVNAGASGLVCQNQQKHKLPSNLPPSIGIFYVENTLIAYQNLARYVRYTFKPKVIALTGSNGKTTTKEFLATLLQDSYTTLASPASFNNRIGVPHTLLNIKPDTQVVVLEMGMNHFGEIKELVQLADPDITLITTVGKAHLEGLQSIDGIAQAKEEIYKYARKDVIKIFNLDNTWTTAMYRRYQSSCSTFTFSQANHKKSDICFMIEDSGIDYLIFSGSICGVKGRVRVSIFGQHHINNLMAATCGALAVGLQPAKIWQNLHKCKAVWGRSQIITLPNEIRVIFDAYNANPDSMQALLAQMAKCKISGQLHICLGDMLEMGPSSEFFHQELGKQVAQLMSSINIGKIAFVGHFAQAFQDGLQSGQSSKTAKKAILLDKYKSDLASYFQEALKPKDILIIKASRGLQLERLLNSL